MTAVKGSSLGRRGEVLEEIDGCPAHAGIDPFVVASPSSGSRLPRPRGDRPRRCHAPHYPEEVAPPTRG